MMGDQALLEWLFASYTCPFFRDPPCSDDDLEFMAQYWELCDYEGVCLDREYCPVIERQYPRLDFSVIDKESV